MSDLFGHHPDTEDEHDLQHAEEATSRRARRQAPAPRPQRNRRRGSVASFVVMIAILLGLGVLVFVGGRALFSPGDDPTAGAVSDYPGPGTGEVTITIPDGATGSDIGLILKDAGVVATVDAFSAAYTANANAVSIQPGSYTLAQQMRASDAVTALLDPNRRADIRITIPEGWRASQIYQRIADMLGVPVADVQTAAHDYAALGLEGPPNTNPDAIDPMEGWLYPSTYTVGQDATATDVVKQMYDRTISELDKLGVAPEDRLRVLTLGSIAIRELKLPDDWGKAVRAMENRLADASGAFNQRLGADTVLQYAWGLRNPGVSMPADEHNTSTDPYNTRKIAGLPPSPIASIDVSVMEAVLYPPEGDWTYWITVNLCTGESYFTSSYDEFLVYKAQLQQWESTFDSAAGCPTAEPTQG